MGAAPDEETPEHRALAAQVEVLYALFEEFPIGARVEHCPCCVTDAEARALVSHPLRSIPGEVLDRYAFKAITTWGSEADLRHFVPAIWERIVFGPCGTSPQIPYEKLPRLGLPPRHLDALATATERWFAYVLVSGKDDPLAPIECAGLMAIPIPRLVATLDARIARLDPPSASGLASLVTCVGGRGAFPWAWWKDDHEQLVARWIEAHAKARLEAAFQAHPDHPDAAEWSYAVDLLSWR